MKKQLGLLAIFFLLPLTVSSCSWFSGSSKEKEAETPKGTAEEMYDGAQGQMDKGNYTKAINQFQDIERFYPFSPLANKAKVMAAYTQYKDEEYDKAIDIIDEYVALNPGSEDIEFMYYLKAISYYDRIQDVKRDQEVTVKAEAAFNEIINRFPKSKYARDAQYKLDLIHDHLAAKEMEVGRFYMKQKNYIAALNRFKEVVKNYDNTEQIEEALYRLVEANLLLGLNDEAVRYATILGYNYSSGKWYERAYGLLKENNLSTSKTFVGRVSDSFGLSSDPASTQPVDLQSSPNIVDTGGWINDDSGIAESEKNTAKTGAKGNENEETRQTIDEGTPEENPSIPTTVPQDDETKIGEPNTTDVPKSMQGKQRTKN